MPFLLFLRSLLFVNLITICPMDSFRKKSHKAAVRSFAPNVATFIFRPRLKVAYYTKCLDPAQLYCRDEHGCYLLRSDLGALLQLGLAPLPQARPRGEPCNSYVYVCVLSCRPRRRACFYASYGFVLLACMNTSIDIYIYTYI